EAIAKRRIGLGITGLADALIMCDTRYGSPEAVELTEQWMRIIQRTAYLTSVELAKEKGVFPLFDKEAYLAGEGLENADDDVRSAIAEHGIRNALLTSVAPTGTISLFADNVSSGLEPVFSFSYTRHVMMPDGSRRDEEVSDYAYRLFRRVKGDQAALPEAFVDSQNLSPRDHLVMQAAVQKFIDSSISKTINCPEEIKFKDFKDIYLQAYEMGCKGCTTYRPNDVTGAVLKKKAADADDKQAELPLVAPARSKPGMKAKPKDQGDSGILHYLTQPLDRPEALPGSTYKVQWPESDHALYITVNDIVQDGRRRPFEVFINSKNTEHYAWTVALTRMISAVFRRGGDVSFVVEELKAVFDPRGGQWMNGRYVPSLLAAIGGVLEEHMIAIGFLPAPGTSEEDAQQSNPKVVNLQDDVTTTGGEAPAGGQTDTRFRQCPKCGQASLIRQEGCDTCTSCAYSKCG
ncbi:MAG: ribonucleoside-diphosphate reductase, adenosylcobalamin-dependent, partial [Rhodospirillales bacterium]|nr:ribonucleoside-diphosphate reductase, adenosylcobalamin-dependent [Rhodospirillales bacterium]